MANTSKIKKVSINAIEKIMKENYKPLVKFDWYGQEIIVTPNIPFREVLDFVNGVAKSCFSVETGEFMPEVKDLATKINIIAKYSNVSLPQDLEKKYDLIYRTDLVHAIISNVNIEQLQEIETAIEDKIENMARANVEALNKRMNEVVESFAELENQVKALFEGVSQEDITNITKAMASSNLTEDNIVKAYMNESKPNKEEAD